MPQPNNKPPNRVAFLLFGWGTGVPSVAPHTVGVAELGSHFASKAMGARSREPRAKIFARSANILVFPKRCGVRFAYPRAERVELARKRQAVGIFSQRANILVPRQSRGGIRFAFCEQGDGSSLT